MARLLLVLLTSALLLGPWCGCGGSSTQSQSEFRPETLKDPAKVAEQMKESAPTRVPPGGEQGR